MVRSTLNWHNRKIPLFSNWGVRLSKLELLLKRIQKPEETKHYLPPPKPSRNLLMLIDRVNTRAWLPQEEEDLMLEIRHLRSEVKWIEHLPGCRFCRLEVELDVERYMPRDMEKLEITWTH